MTPQTIYFCDFDGTIALKDIGNELHKRFSNPQWRTPNRAYRAGRITSRECLWSQYEFFRARREEIEAFVLTHEIDSTFPEFVRWAQQQQCPIIILSDGLGFYIELLLKKYGIEGLPYFSNRAEFEGDRVRIHYPHFRADCSHQCQCGNCKPSHMEPYAEHRRVFIGDGISDRYAAREAEVIYAKGRLCDYCREEQRKFIPFDCFHDVLESERKSARQTAAAQQKQTGRRLRT